MPAFIYKKSLHDDPSGSSVYYWNRRKRAWQESLTKSCEYPTFKGTNLPAKRLFNSWQGMRPHKDWIGRKDLDTFARDNYNTLTL
jgi:hypothetical protein